MAYTNHSLHNSSLGCWDLHNLGLLNDDISSSFVLPNEDNYISTGYLEDALIEFSLRFKRRKLMLCSNDHDHDHGHDHDHHKEDNFITTLNDLGYWNNFNEEEFSHASLVTHDMHYCLEDEIFEKTLKGVSEEVKEIVLDEEAISSAPKLMEMKNNYSSTITYNSDTYSTDSSSIYDEKEKMSKRRKASSITNNSTTKKMVYPFGLVKPGGEEGDITLKDINKRILMPPTRPLKHPVGDFACRPGVSPHGPGLSGKAVVALTRIHTQGRGTITIIRTKG